MMCETASLANSWKNDSLKDSRKIRSYGGIGSVFSSVKILSETREEIGKIASA